ncbi:MFS transporter [Streptomyces virginiae]|uniref:MFS transporter n=1 Tax=Streptomyces virginiae TaxID=1961 RepID=A0ABQ3NKN0_STRVG|nr:MFS transporter [Streptomyces virginiae]MBP2342769.1 MFS family permease [Streptomyces virginiae]GGP80191.1 MFS transporter [Streptomyces virginiae]GHI13343.1 MFS transporter [Streptomyces virginiae]
MSTDVRAALAKRRLGTPYELLLFAFVVSGLGNWIYRLALPLMVFELTGSALNTAVVYALEYAPLLLLSLPGGVIADRFERRRILVVGDLAATVLAGILALVVTSGSSSVLLVYLAAFLLACVEPLYYPAFQGMVPDLVRDKDLERANAWMQMGDNVMSLAGPAVAGVLIAAVGYEGAIWADAGTFAVSALAMVAIRTRSKPPAAQGAGAEPVRRNLLREVKDSLVHITRDNRPLLSGAVLFALANLGTWLVQANLVYYLSDYQSMSPALIGVVFAAQGAGAVLGAAVCPWLGRRFAPGRVVIAGTVLAGAGIVLLIPLRDVVSISVLWALIYGIGTVNMVSWFVLRQRTVPPQMLGRVVATTRMIAFMSIPVASVLGGVLEQRWHNMYLIIAIAGGLRLLVGLGAMLSPLNSSAGWRNPADS